MFAYLTGDGDAHAKNFSVVQDPSGEWRPSPAYDVPSTYPHGNTTLAMPMGRDDVVASDFLALGATLGLPARAVLRVLRDQAERTETWLPPLDDLPFDRRRARSCGPSCATGGVG